MYLNGEGVPKNPEEASQWFQLAASQGHQRAGEMLEKIKQESEKQKE